MRCGNCAYWNVYAPDKQADGVEIEFSERECRRYPPRLRDKRHGNGLENGWVMTEFYGWCGEFKQKEEK